MLIIHSKNESQEFIKSYKVGLVIFMILLHSARVIVRKLIKHSKSWMEKWLQLLQLQLERTESQGKSFFIHPLSVWCKAPFPIFCVLYIHASRSALVPPRPQASWQRSDWAGSFIVPWYCLRDPRVHFKS